MFIGVVILKMNVTSARLGRDPFRGLAISDMNGAMDPHGKVTTRFRRWAGGMTP